MRRLTQPINPEKVAEITGGKLLKRHDVLIENVSELENSFENSLCFINEEKYLKAAQNSDAKTLLISPEIDTQDLQANLIVVDKPYFEFMKIVKIFLNENEINFKNNNQTEIHETAEIAEDVTIAAGSYIGKDVIIGKNSVVGPNCVILEGTKVGENCHFVSNVTIYNNSILGDNVILHSGAAIGADGFGYFEMNKKQIKIPQIGNTILEDDVEIGANTCIDRATLGSTIIGEGSKLDNLVQIGHNCVIGKNCIICSQVGLAGSTVLGDGVYLAGQVGAAGHLKVGDYTKVGAQSGISKDIPANKLYFGTPAIPASDQKRITVIQKKLLKAWKPLRKLLKNIDK